VIVARGTIEKTTSGKLRRQRMRERYELGEWADACLP
jgi:acyl-CoA synthetase (AMP-forming)/AMP-acid ligase II